MLTCTEASSCASHLNARTTVEEAPLSGFLVLSLAWVWSCLRPAGIAGFLVLVALLLAGPWLVARALPRRNWTAFLASHGAYVLNGLLLAGLAYREVAGLDFAFLEELPQLAALLTWSAVLLSGLYYVLQFQEWKGRLLGTPALRELLAHPPPAPQVEALSLLLDAVQRPSPGMPWAEFRTLRPSPMTGRRFLKLDTVAHGTWRVALLAGYALLVSRKEGRVEVVEQGGLRIAAEDPRPGAREVLCLVRWNRNLREGRTTPAHFASIREWNGARG
jgi:hypothetical protein